LVEGNPEESKYKMGLSQGYNNLAALQINQGRKNEARQHLQKSIEINEKLMQEHPKDRRYRQITLFAYMNLGTLQASLGDHEGAKLSWQQSINIATQLVQENPAIINYRGLLALSYSKLTFRDQSRLDEAITVHQELLKYVPNDEQAWRYLGWAFRKQGKLEEAIAAFQRQLEISPNSAEAWSSLGSTFWGQENHTAAADAFARGLAVQPNNLSLLSNDAELALVQGDKDRFRARMAAALPQVTTRDRFFALLPFLVWLDNPTQGWDSVMTAIRELEPGGHLQLEFFDHRTRHSTSGCVNPTDSTPLHRIFHRPDRPASIGRTSYRPVESAGASGRTPPPPGYRRASPVGRSGRVATLPWACGVTAAKRRWRVLTGWEHTRRGGI
jgi:tetratricopeptide (TPR) repeat protein